MKTKSRILAFSLSLILAVTSLATTDSVKVFAEETTAKETVTEETATEEVTTEENQTEKTTEQSTETEAATEESGSEAANAGALLYVTVSAPRIEAGETENILVGIQDAQEVSGAELTVRNLTTDETYTVTGEFYEDSSIAFASTFSAEGEYQLEEVGLVLAEESCQISLTEAGIDARFGVGMDVLTAPDAVAEDESAAEDTASASDQDGVAVIEDASDSCQAVAEAMEEAGVAPVATCTTATAASVTSSSNVTIVIDPGHGGKDGGCGYSHNGVYYAEKDLNLKIAKYLKAELETYYNVTVYMTRTTDVYVELDDRVSYAKSVGADYFICVHNNASTSSSANGAEVYYPNSNYNAQIGAEGKALASSIEDQLVALGLANNGIKIRNSESGDTYEDGSLCDYYRVIRRSKQAGFPGIIIEHAFVSNASDVEKYLSSDAKLKTLGVADATGIAKYLKLSKNTYDGVDYTAVFDADYYINKYADVKKACGTDKAKALKLFVTSGMKEGRQGRAEFDVNYYKATYSSLAKKYGSDLTKYYLHFINTGLAKGYRGSETYDVYSYRSRYPSLYKKYKNDFAAYFKYYITTGVKKNQDATYDATKYTVRFYDEDGTLLSTKKVRVGTSVTAPKSGNGAKSGKVTAWDASSTALGCVTQNIDATFHTYWKLNGVDYTAVFDGDYYLSKYSDVKKACGSDYVAALTHFVNYGMSEKRQGNAAFDVYAYRARYSDLRKSYGSDWKSYYQHYLDYGLSEGRNGAPGATYTVKFYTSDGTTLLGSKKVKYGHSVSTSFLNRSGATMSLSSSVSMVKKSMKVAVTYHYYYNGVDYSPVFDGDYYLAKYKDLRNAYGNDYEKAFQHFINYGMKEGRQACSSFNPKSYKKKNADLAKKYGNNWKSYYIHYLKYGISQGRPV